MAHGRLRSAIQGRGILLLPAAAFALHQLRYALTYGSHAEAVLAAQGHSYMSSVAPWIVLMLAFGASSFVVRLARGEQRVRRPSQSLVAVSSALLLAIYVVQELLEGAFATGHPGGIAGVFGHGGWWAIPLAVLFGAAIASLLRLADVLVETVTRRPAFGAAPLLHAPTAVALPLHAPLARAAAGRAPPTRR
ncbi:MAG: hypothetical protein JO186_12830 [Actinobacteria bacterium]|nr:hypothetical protein [Actinomycetota bacterium]